MWESWRFATVDEAKGALEEEVGKYLKDHRYAVADRGRGCPPGRA
jgi:hypothetical protein